MLARNSDFSRFAFSSSRDCHCSRVFCSARSAVAALNALLELAGERLELLVQALVLDLLGEIVKHRDDCERLAATVEDLSRDDLDRQLDARVRDAAASSARAAPARGLMVKSEMNVVNFVSFA